MKKTNLWLLGASVAVIMLSGAHSLKAEEMRKELKGADGNVIGTVDLKETAQGVLLSLDLKGLKPGASHAIHIHETGKCSPDFKAAGGHFNPAGHDHGMMADEGQHAGDMPNLHVGADGTLKKEILNTMITTELEDKDGRYSIHDEDGSAIIIHEGQDDYTSQPTGDAGGRMACAVLADPK